MADTLRGQVDTLEQAAQVRAQWLVDTAADRARAADSEAHLAARGATTDPVYIVTADEWLAADHADRLADDPHRDITDTDLDESADHVASPVELADDAGAAKSTSDSARSPDDRDDKDPVAAEGRDATTSSQDRVDRTDDNQADRGDDNQADRGDDNQADRGDDNQADRTDPVQVGTETDDDEDEDEDAAVNAPEDDSGALARGRIDEDSVRVPDADGVDAIRRLAVSVDVELRSRASRDAQHDEEEASVRAEQLNRWHYADHDTQGAEHGAGDDAADE